MLKGLINRVERAEGNKLGLLFGADLYTYEAFLCNPRGFADMQATARRGYIKNKPKSHFYIGLKRQRQTE